MTDPSLFSAGALFTQDYLTDGIKATPAYAAIDPTAVRERLRAIIAGFPHASQPNEATTESDLVWPVLGLLGWADYLTQQNLSASGRVDVPDGLLFIDADAKKKANTHGEEWKRYAHGAAIVESKRWGRALDRAVGRKDTDRETPSTQLLRYLRRIDDLTSGALRWGILTNGNRWRLYFAGARSTIDDYLELDLSRIIGPEGMGDADLPDKGVTPDERDHWLRVFVAIFSRAAFARAAPEAPSFHDLARREAAFYEERVARNLSDLVFNQLYPALGKAVAQSAPAAPLDEIRQATLILLYRLLFVLYAEDRGLLPVKDARFDDYALRVSRLEVGRRKDRNGAFSSVATQIWSRFASLARMLDKGDASVGLPPYNGGLFSAEETPLLKTIALSDAVMADALDILSFERREGTRRYINYRDLSVQQLGSIYERLLEFELVRGDDGIVDVRPNIFARKSSGSYYTPDDLVLLILDETLSPLIEDAHAAFARVVADLKPGDDEEYRLNLLAKADPARAITRLRVCDPAMGSGHFLVSLVDRLTNHALDAIAEAAALAKDKAGLEYESPVAAEIRRIRATIRGNAQDQGWIVAEEQLDDPRLAKRMVLKRCVHGVDKNPMAVELAKVSLWLHTFTVGAPLSFIDHHLAVGDSLFGLWVRDAIDKAGRSGELLYFEELRTAERQATVMQRIEALTDADINEAQESSDMWRDVEIQIGPFDSFVSFMQALDWLNLSRAQRGLVTQWLDGRFGDPLPISRGRKEPEAWRARPEDAEAFHTIWQAARALIEEEHFLNWQIHFPGIWKNWASAAREGGFDAVVGNPPWDRIKLQQVEWFAARKPEIARAQRASDRSRMIAALKKADDPLFADYEKADRRAADTLRIARQSGHYPLLSRGDLNLYSLFVERAHALVKPNGMVGLLTPSGIASDLSASAFFRKVATGGHLKALYDFENRRTRFGLEPFFPDVDTRFKFVAMIASPGRTFEATQCGFFLQAMSELANPEQCFPVTAADFTRVNPNTGTAPIFRTRRDMALTTAIYARCPVLVDRTSGEPSVWPLRYVRMLDMANDSGLFRTREELEGQEGAWPVEGNRWQSVKGEWVPLYEGKMVQAFDHRAADIVLAEGNVFRPGQGIDLTAEEHGDPARLPNPRYWAPVANIGWDAPTDWCLAVKDITSVTNIRTTIAMMIPHYGAGHTLPALFPDQDMSAASYTGFAPLALANLNSVIFDYLARQKVHGNHLAWYLLEQLPVIPPDAYARAFGPKTAAEIVREAVLELTYTAHDMAAFARDMGYVDAAGNVLPPFGWDEERRLHLRAKLDALYFLLYGIFDPADGERSRDDVRYIYSTFPIVEREETARWGRYRSRDLALAWINALLAGQPDAKVAG